MTQFQEEAREIEKIYGNVEPMALLMDYAAQCGVPLDEAVLNSITCAPRVASGRVCPEVFVEYILPEGTSPSGVDPAAFADWFDTVSEGVGIIGYIPVKPPPLRPF